MLRLIITLLFASIATSAHASKEALTERQVASIKRQVPEATEVFTYASVGTLNQNAESYLVAYFEKKEGQRRNAKKHMAEIKRCAIFFMRYDSLTLYGKSGPLTSSGPADTIDCAVTSDSVEIHHRQPTRNCTEFNETWKFKPGTDGFILVGYESASSDGCKSPVFSETGTSINFLSNEARLWRKSGEVIELWSEASPWNKPFVIAIATRNKELSTRTAPHPQFVFERFDIESFKRWTRQQKDLCGVIMENDKYVACR